MHAPKLFLLFFREFWLFTAELALSPRDGHAFAGAHADKIGFKFSECGQDVEKHLSHWVGGIVNRRSQSKFHTLGSLHKSAIIVRFERTSSELMRRHEFHPFEVALGDLC